MQSHIKHIVVIVKENQTFNNYVSTFSAATGVTLVPAANPPPDDPDHCHRRGCRLWQ